MQLAEHANFQNTNGMSPDLPHPHVSHMFIEVQRSGLRIENQLYETIEICLDSGVTLPPSHGILASPNY